MVKLLKAPSTTSFRPVPRPSSKNVEALLFEPKNRKKNLRNGKIHKIYKRTDGIQDLLRPQNQRALEKYRSAKKYPFLADICVSTSTNTRTYLHIKRRTKISYPLYEKYLKRKLTECTVHTGGIVPRNTDFYWGIAHYIDGHPCIRVLNTIIDGENGKTAL